MNFTLCSANQLNLSDAFAVLQLLSNEFIRDEREITDERLVEFKAAAADGTGS